jgi:hypothetical protein
VHHEALFVEDPRGLDRVLEILEMHLDNIKPWSGFLGDLSNDSSQRMDSVALLQLLLDRGQAAIQYVLPVLEAARLQMTC